MLVKHPIGSAATRVLTTALAAVWLSGCPGPHSSRGFAGHRLGPVTVTSGCRVRASLPDPRCTPGSVLGASAVYVCRPGYARGVRHVPALERLAVRRAYGVALRHRPQELDHLVALELGGANDPPNLWPESALPRPGYFEKDALENLLHRRVCAGHMSLADAQRTIARDWVATWERAGRPR